MEGARPAKARVVVSGILFWYPLAGVTYQFLHYLIGLKRLGYDVYYAEDPSQWISDPVRHDTARPSLARRRLHPIELTKHARELGGDDRMPLRAPMCIRRRVHLDAGACRALKRSGQVDAWYGHGVAELEKLSR